MKASRYFRSMAAGIALTFGIAAGASAATFMPDDYTAAGGFSCALSNATTKLLDSFALDVGNRYELSIESPAGASSQKYSVGGVMAAFEVPLPGTLGLLGTGMLALGMARRKQPAN